MDAAFNTAERGQLLERRWVKRTGRGCRESELASRNTLCLRDRRVRKLQAQHAFANGGSQLDIGNDRENNETLEDLALHAGSSPVGSPL